MTKLSRFSVIALVLAMVLGFALAAAPAQAAGTTFDVKVKHNINGVALGLDKELPVDVYINGAYQFTFEFGETVPATLPAGNYSVDVKLANTNITVMSLSPTDIPADVEVIIKAQLSADKTPILKVKVK